MHARSNSAVETTELHDSASSLGKRMMNTDRCSTLDASSNGRISESSGRIFSSNGRVNRHTINGTAKSSVVSSVAPSLEAATPIYSTTVAVRRISPKRKTLSFISRKGNSLKKVGSDFYRDIHFKPKNSSTILDGQHFDSSEASTPEQFLVQTPKLLHKQALSDHSDHFPCTSRSAPFCYACDCEAREGPTR